MPPARWSIAAPVLLCLATFAPPALADWPAGGLQVSTNPRIRGPARLVPNGAGTLSVLMRNDGNPQSWDVNRVTVDGEHAPGWSSEQWGFAEAGNETWNVAGDGAGGVWHVYATGVYPNWEVALERRDAGASLSTMPPVAIGVVKEPAVAADDSGGAYVSWWTEEFSDRLRLMRIGADGLPAGGWGGSGVTVLGPLEFGDFGFGGTAMLPDGEGGVFVLSRRLQGVQVHRIGPAGAFAAGWGASGLALEDSNATNLALVPGDSSHVLASWTIDGRVMLQRIAHGGTRDAAWPASGVQVFSAALGPSEACFAPDGQGGVHATCRTASGGVRLVHVLAGGTLAPGFPADGLSPVGSDDLAPVAPRCATGRDGGVVVAWTDEAEAGWRVRASWLLADGTPDPLEPPGPRTIAAAAPPFRSSLRDVLPDGDGGVYVLWADRNLDLEYDDCHVTHAPRSQSLAVTPGATTTLALAAGPNPARGSVTARFSLPDARPARLELLDLAGRRVRSLDAAGAGGHTERFGDLGGLAPGVYLLRLTHGGHVRTARVAVIR